MSIAAVALICIFLFANGIPAIKEIGFTKFIFGTQWRPTNNIYGILPMIVGSIYVTAGALIIGVPIGLLISYIFMQDFVQSLCTKYLNRELNSWLEFHQ